MKKTLILIGLMSLASVFAAPSFSYVKDATMNGMMTKGASEHIELAAAPGLSLQARAITDKHAIFFYSTKDAVRDAQAAYEFYQGALLEHGWMADHMMGAMQDGAMMSDKDKMTDAMSKDAMGGKGDAMMGKDAMMKDSAMSGKDAAMVHDDAAMMAKGIFQTTLTQGGHTISLKVRPNGDRVEVDLELM